MRNEREIIEKILDAARQDDSVRVVIRTDLVPKRKYLYTYNFCFVVNDVEKTTQMFFNHALAKGFSCFAVTGIILKCSRTQKHI